MKMLAGICFVFTPRYMFSMEERAYEHDYIFSTWIETPPNQPRLRIALHRIVERLGALIWVLYLCYAVLFHLFVVLLRWRQLVPGYPWESIWRCGSERLRVDAKWRNGLMFMRAYLLGRVYVHIHVQQVDVDFEFYCLRKFSKMTASRTFALI